MLAVKVKEVPVTPYMSEKAVKIVTDFNKSGNELYLLIYTGYDITTLDDEGMYDFLFKIDDEGTDEDAKLCRELEKVFNELWDVARPVHFSSEDVITV